MSGIGDAETPLLSAPGLAAFRPCRRPRKWPLSASFRGRICLAAAAILGFAAGVGCSAAQEGLDADLVLRVACPQDMSRDKLRLIKRRLFARGFDVVDVAGIASARLPDYPFRVKIEALDAQGRSVTMNALNLDPSSRTGPSFTLHLAIYSRPPTKHDAELEEAVRSWAADDLGCAQSGLDMHDNSEAAMSTYDNLIADARNLFKEAGEMKVAPDLLLRH